VSEKKPQGRLRVGLRVAASLVRNPDAGLRSAISFLLRDVICESLPMWVRRYWLLGAIALGLYLCEAVILLCVLRRPDLLPGAKDWDWSDRLGFGQLAIEALALALAIGGALIAIGEIRRALEKPRLFLSFQGLSTSETVAVRQKGPGHGWESRFDLQLWNLSDVMAQNIRVRLSFENLGPFKLEIKEARTGINWKCRQDLPGSQWVFDPGPTLMLHGGEVEFIGFIRMSLPAIVVEDIGGHLGAPHRVYIRAFLLDASSRREQRLFLDFRPWHGPYPQAT